VSERTEKDARWVRSDDDAEQVRAAVKKTLATALSADAAVQIALLNNRGLQATYAELGIAEADLVQAGRLRNPVVSFARLRRGEELEIDRAFLIDVLSLITMPLRTDLERRRFALTQMRVATETLQVAAETRRTYFRAVAAQEGAKYMAQVKTTAEAGAELARRMAAVGNFSKLDQAREQVFYAETTAQLARVQQMAVAEREKLTRLMGLWGEDIDFELPDRLPELPKAVREQSHLEAQALEQRLDVQANMQAARNIAASLGLTRINGFLNVLEVGYQRNTVTGMSRQTGYQIDLSLPIFDWGGARVASAQYTYMQAVNLAADTAVQARSEVREAYTAYRTTYDLAKHYRDEIVPLRKRIADESVLRYNGMLVSVFELLAEARQQVVAVNAYIESLRDFWISESNLTLALTGASPGAIGTSGAAGIQATSSATSPQGH
jgi:outer membrane protein TolC